MVVEEGWTWPTILAIKGIVRKGRSKYIIDEVRATHCKSNALNAIFDGVDMKQFKVISMCELANEA